MDNDQHDNAPEHYFAAIDEAAEIPGPHDVAMAAVSGDMRHELFPLPGYVPMTEDAHAQHGPFFFPPSTADNAAPPAGAAPFGFQHAPSHGPGSYHAPYSWQQSGHHMVYADPGAAAGEVGGSLGAFGFVPYGNEHHHEGQTGAYPPTFEQQGYVAPAGLSQPAPFAYDWNTLGAPASEQELGSAHSQAGHGSTPMSPIETATGARTPSSFTSTSSGGGYSSMYAGTANIDAHVATSLGSSGIAFVAGAGAHEALAAKRAKKRKSPHGQRSAGKTGAAAGPSAATAASSSGESSISGAGASSSRDARASARAAHPPADKGDDKKPRGSHNLVEKQYRNRLNARFEDLMNSLPPESLRAHGNEGGEGADVAERRASKAEVLEMARQHIQQLEQQRDDLARERDELLGTSQRLQQIYESQSPSQSVAGENRRDNDEEEEDEG